MAIVSKLLVYRAHADVDRKNDKRRRGSRVTEWGGGAGDGFVTYRDACMTGTSERAVLARDFVSDHVHARGNRNRKEGAEERSGGRARNGT